MNDDKEPVTLLQIPYKADTEAWKLAWEATFRKQEELRYQLLKTNQELMELKKQKYPHKCCRCWPNSIRDNGLCSCCLWDHVTNVSTDVPDPDYGF